MNNILFRTGGDWETTTLHNNGIEVLAAQLFIELRAGRDEIGDPYQGGVFNGTDLTAIIRPQDNPEMPFDIFPGRLEMDFPGHSIIVQNEHPLVELEYTRVWYNGREVTRHVMDVYADINSVDDIVKAFITLYKAHWFSTDEVATYTIF